jgi:2-keto-3-deoxy-L-rhamnonate aldolase
MTPSSPPPPGIYVPVPTFFLSPSTHTPTATSVAPPLDLPTQAQHAIHLAKCGIKGLVLLGSTGEAIGLTNSERTAVISHVRQELTKAGFKDYPLIAGTATQSIEETVTQLKEAKKAGAQWGLVLAPGYFAPVVSQTGLVSWYESIAGLSPIPIMMYACIPPFLDEEANNNGSYHYPGVSNNIAISPSTFRTLSLYPNVVGCKLSHGDVSGHAQVACNPSIDHDSFAVFTGLGQQLLPVLSVGCAGAIDGLAGFFPRSVVQLYNLFRSTNSKDGEKWKEMRDLQYKISAAEDLVVKWGTVGIKEAVSRVLGLGERDGTRAPLHGGFPGGEKEWEAWRGVMDGMAEVEKKLELEQS